MLVRLSLLLQILIKKLTPLCLKLISELDSPIYLNYAPILLSYYERKGDEYWVYLSKDIAYDSCPNFAVPANRKIMTCEDLVLKSTSSWVKPKEPTEEIKEEESGLIPLSKIKQLKKARYAEDLKTINELINGNFMVCDLVVVTSRSLRNKVDDKGLIELIKKAGYEVESRENSLVIKGWGEEVVQETKEFNLKDLPKPFYPMDGDTYFYISENGIESVTFCEIEDSDLGLAENAQCFRTKEDAQVWLDFMKSKLE